MSRLFTCATILLLFSARPTLAAAPTAPTAFVYMGEVNSGIGDTVTDVSLSPAGDSAIVSLGKGGFSLVQIDPSAERLSVQKYPAAKGKWIGDGRVEIVNEKGDQTFLSPAETSKNPLPQERTEEFHFEDGLGQRVQESVSLSHVVRTSVIDGRPVATGEALGVPRLFYVSGSMRKEITTPAADRLLGADYVFWFTYDPLTRRVCARAGNCCIIYDVDTGTRQFLPTHVRNTELNAYVDYLPIPGTNYLLQVNNHLDQSEGEYVGYDVRVVNVAGELVSEVCGTEGHGGDIPPREIRQSEKLLVVVVDHHYGGEVAQFYSRKALP